jgi:hypothetical protein
VRFVRTFAALCLSGCLQPAPPPEATPPEVTTPSLPTPSAPVEEPLPEALPSFFDDPDPPHLRSLADSAIRSVQVGFGGRSLAFRIELEDGTKGYFKPEQSFSGAHWYSEIAAYHLDRILGLGRAPAVSGRQIEWSRLERAAEDYHGESTAVIEEGFVRGAFIHWIDGHLRPWQLGQDWEHFVRVHGGLEITPFQRPVDYRARINGRAVREETELGSFPEASESLMTEEIAELSDLILFDYLISNVDRWGGEYTNVRRLNGRLIYLDNGAGFWVNPRQGLMESRIEVLQRFRRSTHESLEDFRLEDYETSLANDPLAPVLPPHQLEGLALRVDRAIAHIDEMVERFGEESVFIE